MRLPLSAISIFLASTLFISATVVVGARPITTATNVSTTNTVIKGKDITKKERDPLMRSLNRDRTRTYRARRFEIIFFTSLPVTLWLSWTLLEFMIRKTRDVNNPNKEFQSPHYIYMFTSSVATSLYIAIQDQKRYGIEPDSGPAERKVKIPIMGIRF